MNTLARLSFWVPLEGTDGFEAAYKKKLVPILKKHGLEESSERGRKTVEGVVSRLFEVKTPSEVVRKRRALEKDSGWQEALRGLGKALGMTEAGGLLRTRFGIYQAVAGSGKMVKAGRGVRQGSWQTFGMRDGVPQTIVRALLQDREGYLWVGTYGGGVSRYDGETFVTFTTEDGLADNWVRSLLQDREGHLWVGTDGGGVGTYGGGVSRYDGETFVTFTTEDGLASTWVSSLLEDREGYLWVGTDVGGGVSRYEEAHRSEGAHQKDRETFVTFTTEDGLASNNVQSLLEDREGHLWVGTMEGGVSRYDPSASSGGTGKEFVTFTTEDGLGSNDVSSLLEDREGHLWVGTMEGGVSRYDPSASSGGTGKEFVTFTTEDGLAGNDVLSLLEDREGHLWFGTGVIEWTGKGGGVSRYDPSASSGGTGKEFVTFTIEDGLVANQVRCMVEDREGDLWIGTYGGVSRYDAHHVITFTTRDGLVNNGVMCVVQDRRGDLWFGTWRGVSRYDPSASSGGTGKAFSPLEGLIGPYVWDMLEDREGHLWVGTDGAGLSRYDPSASSGGTGKEFVTFTTEQGLASNRVRGLLEDREGHLWVGTWGGGMSRYDPSASSGGTGKEFVTFTSEDGLGSDIVYCILEDREGYLWFGMQGGGVSRYDGARAHHLAGAHRKDRGKFVTFTAEDGLACNNVTSILEDREGHLWFGTWGGGVSCYDGTVFQTFSKKDGLAHDAVQEILHDRNGDLWITTEGGVTRYRPYHTPPRVRVTHVIADRRYDPTKEIHIPASQRMLMFEFQGASFTTHPDAMAYVYKLEGYDPDWKPNYTGRIEVQDLPLGEYTFHVRAVDRDLNYSEPCTVRVTVEPDPYVQALTDALKGSSGKLLGKSDALRQVQRHLTEVAPTDVTVLISGETGTGKGLAARTVHEWSSRKHGPFLQVSCGALPDPLVESELFGHERGAFTGALCRKPGKVELARRGTLFLDEIGDMPLEAQVKLLRLLEERTFERVGGTQTLRADMRVIAATNRDLLQMVQAKQFREDLYFRLQVFPVRMPSLLERLEDIPLLAVYFMERMAGHLNKRVTRLTPEALDRLTRYAWPGNVRELEHAVQRAVIVCPGWEIRAEDIVLGGGVEGGRWIGEVVSLEEHERGYIRRVVEETGWVIKGPRGAAALLGIPASTLRSRMKKLGIVRSELDRA